jgi:hypothetical protein
VLQSVAAWALLNNELVGGLMMMMMNNELVGGLLKDWLRSRNNANNNNGDNIDRLLIFSDLLFFANAMSASTSAFDFTGFEVSPGTKVEPSGCCRTSSFTSAAVP